MYYRLKLRQFMFLYKHDRTISFLISKYLDSGIESVNSGDFWLTLKFKNGSTLVTWNANKYYAWLKRGELYNPRGLVYQWQSARPSPKVMYKLKSAIEAFFKAVN